VEIKSMKPQHISITNPLNIFILFIVGVIELLDRLCCISGDYWLLTLDALLWLKQC
jgi:hypothetical protein